MHTSDNKNSLIIEYSNFNYVCFLLITKFLLSDCALFTALSFSLIAIVLESIKLNT